MSENRPSFAERCRAESTGNVIFLLQSRRWQHLGCPDGYEFDDDGECVGKPEEFEPLDDGHFPKLTSAQLAEKTFGEWDAPCAVEEWLTEAVFLSREEAEAFAKQTEYRYRDGWRVYGVCAAGELAELIKTT